MPNRYKSVCCVPFKGIDNAYVVISAGKSERNGNKIAKRMSFFFDNGDVGAEWEPENGPITVIYKCAKDHKEGQPHWFYDYYKGQGYWSQIAVDEEGLPHHFLAGDYEMVFGVLRKWADR